MDTDRSLVSKSLRFVAWSEGSLTHALVDVMKHRFVWLMVGLLAYAAGAQQHSAALSDQGLDKLAIQIEQACLTASGDAIARRDRCSENLANINELDYASLNHTVRWGGHAPNDYTPGHNSLTVLDALVWRKLYLSLFEFSSQHSLDIMPDDSRLLRLEARLRPLPASEYPYPFWHSANKWHAYQQTCEISLLFRGGKLVAAYRETRRDLPTTEHVWSGFWTTDNAGKQPPRTALFSYLLSPGNPNEARLTAAYRAMAMGARKYECAECHTPANPDSMNPVIILNLPSQALSARHEIVHQIATNRMPPGQGINDRRERERLLSLAREFEEIGDEALAYEQQHSEKANPNNP